MCKIEYLAVLTLGLIAALFVAYEAGHVVAHSLNASATLIAQAGR